MRVYIHTLGCKVNQYESQAIENILQSRGHVICSKDDDLDAFVVNTCAVTAESGRKSRQIIRQLKSAHPGAVCAVCGCYSQIEPELAARLDIDLVSGSGGRMEFIEKLECAAAAQEKVILTDDPMKRRVFERLPSGNIGSRTRATLKIEDGCSNFCSYCIIPYARGPVRSLPIDALERQARRLKEDGYREIIITGIEIASYGRDLKNGLNLADAVCTAAEEAPGVRIRLGSLEARVVTEEFAERIAATGAVCPHFHLSLQSGCDKTLKNMNRRYDSARFYEACCTLRRYFPGCALTADLIVGFPGETEDDFRESMEFIKKCGFYQVHVFPYSRRPGTAAAEMDGQIPNFEKHRRAKTAGEISERMEKEYLESRLGKILSVLFETEENGISRGHGENYVPVYTDRTGLHNKVCSVRVTKIFKDGLFGDITEENN